MTSPAPSGPARNEYLDFAKGFLIFTVVLGHLIQFNGYDRGSRAFFEDPVFKAIYLFHMPLFMAVSGYLAYGSIAKYAFGALLKRRAEQLLLPIFTWGTLTTAVTVGRSVGLRGVPMESELARLPLRLFGATIGEYWFLWALLFALVAVAALRAVKWDTASVLAGLCVAVLFVPDVGHTHLDKSILPFFCLGYLVARHGLPAWTRTTGFWIAAVIASVAIYAVWQRETYIYVSKLPLTVESLELQAFRLVACTIVSAVVMKAAFLAYRAAPWRGLVFLGKASFGVYLMHLFVLLALVPRFDHLLKNSPWYSVTLGFAAACLLSALCALAVWGAERLPKVRLLFFGGR